MARPPLDPPSDFARLVSSAVRREMGERMMTVASLSRRLGKSPKYARERLRDTFEFTLADLERFCQSIGIEPEVFIGQIERSQLHVNPAPPLHDGPPRSLRELLAVEDDDEDEEYDPDGENELVQDLADDNVVHGKFGVGGPAEDLGKVARPAEEEQTDEQ